MRRSGYILVTFMFLKRDRRWEAYCIQLGTATFGRSLPEAQEKLREAVTLHLNTLEDVGERERFFKKHNIEFYLQKPKRATVPISSNKRTFLQPYVQPLGRFVHA